MESKAICKFQRVSPRKTRLVAQNITDYEAYIDSSDAGRVLIRFPWASTTETPDQAVAELGQTAMLSLVMKDKTIITIADPDDSHIGG